MLVFVIEAATSRLPNVRDELSLLLAKEGHDVALPWLPCRLLRLGP